MRSRKKKIASLAKYGCIRKSNHFNIDVSPHTYTHIHTHIETLGTKKIHERIRSNPTAFRSHCEHEH